jgi:NAD(P)H-dependent flavin oxidoreductase YrpB (nitropropane dioxygenase family)
MVTKEKFQEASDGGLLACGQGIGLGKAVKPMKDIIEEVVEEAHRATARVNTVMPLARTKYMPHSCPD